MTMSQSSVDPLLVADAVAGLWQSPPVLPAKWLYDKRGSELFDEITRLPEYYPTRRETEILRRSAAEIVSITDARTMIELGSGTSEKTRLLLSAFAARGTDFTYVPLDVSVEMLTYAANQVSAEFPEISVQPLHADFGEPDLDLADHDGPRMAIFLGGTIGNLDPTERSDFYRHIAGALRSGDYFLLGADLIKDTGRLIAAYNDRAGVTADFNRNVIEVLRKGLDATGLYTDDFDHIARWNPPEHRIEMWLRARRDVHARFGAIERTWELPRGAEILTEISTKFNLSSLHDELAAAGLRQLESWTDHADDFAVVLGQVS
ncbi:L-histidine N(alpha)-methyltransferase [Williamsia sp. 1138]|uniref:L-histidine N(alpha)-methyltransferase n=1 Tax=Williamsia sp. 1138 TaxID=1903117 RepID=UPI001FEDEF5A|nr:L-histidine N(alpha)-methyltransferase [Williamsia sp. 1138]